MTWDDFARYYDWEFNIFYSEQQKDVAFWLELAAEYGDPILELACGSGRISIPLAEEGHIITALDNSAKMLDKLHRRSKHLHNISIVNSDMVDFNLKKKFKIIFISYSSFQQILDRDDQLRCLYNIYDHLRDDGLFALDIGTHVCEGKAEMAETHQYTANYPEDDSTVSMFTSYKTDIETSIRHWEDNYVKIGKYGDREIFTNKISLKECDQEYMSSILDQSGFKLLNIFGSFAKGELNLNSNNAIYLAEK